MRLSPSIAYGCVDLLDILSRNSDVERSNVQDFPITSVNPTEVVNLLSRIGWVEVDKSDKVSISDRGTKIQELPLLFNKIRWLILDFLDSEKPEWLTLLSGGRADTMRYVPEEISQTFDECELIEREDVDIVKFWSRLMVIARVQKDMDLSDVGANGELLTIMYEQERTGEQPIWISLDRPGAGYDVRSIISKSNSDALRIEVKMSIKEIKSAYFYISRNQWNCAIKRANFKFYVWSVIGDSSNLAILDPDQIKCHIPNDVCNGEWQSIKIPFVAIRNCFSPVKNIDLYAALGLEQ